MITVLMFSGGVDSTLCLKFLVDRGEVPFLFYVKTEKLKRKHMIKARRIAREISPDSTFYVFESTERDYRALYEDEYPYYYIRMKRSGKDKFLSPLLFADKVVLGYNNWIYYTEDNQRKFRGKTQRAFIKFIRKYSLPFELPLINISRPHIDKQLDVLSQHIKENIVSSTRSYLPFCEFVE